MRHLPLTITAGLATAFTYTSVALAAFAGPTPDIPGLADTSLADNPRSLVMRGLIVVLNFLALAAVVVIIISAVRMMISQGEEEARERLKKTIIFALAGLAIVLFARVIVGLITSWLAGAVT